MGLKIKYKPLTVASKIWVTASLCSLVSYCPCSPHDSPGPLFLEPVSCFCLRAFALSPGVLSFPVLAT